MASGVNVSDDCIATYQQLKLGKTFKYLFFKLNDDLSEIVVDKTSNTSDYAAFVADFPATQCRWAVYDFEFEKPESGLRKKLCFVSWSPDVAKVKDKMVFASSHEALKQKLDGIGFEVQGTDRSEISYGTVLAKALTLTH